MSVPGCAKQPCRNACDTFTSVTTGVPACGRQRPDVEQAQVARVLGGDGRPALRANADRPQRDVVGVADDDARLGD